MAPHAGDNNDHPPPSDLEDAFVDHTGQDDRDWINREDTWGERFPDLAEEEREHPEATTPPPPEVFDQETYERVTLTAFVLTALAKTKVVSGVRYNRNRQGFISWYEINRRIQTK